MNEKTFGRIINEGGEGYNPYRKQSGPTGNIKKYMDAVGKRDKLQDKLAYGDITNGQRDEITAALAIAQAELNAIKKIL